MRDPSLALAEGLRVPLQIVTEKCAFVGRTGSGKTYAALKLAELMLAAGAQIGALDPVGVWRALRVPATPGGRAFPVYVFGGLYGDLPLQPTAGAVIADVVADRGISFVLDVSQFVPSEQQRFAREFAERFYQRRKAAPAAIHLFLEECQEFIPQNPMGQEALTLHAFQRLWKLGRNFGIGGSLISQRPQEISKKAFNMTGTLFAFQMTGPQERKTVRSWVADHGVATDIESVLQRLGRGQPHVESPTFLEVSKTVRILPRETADLSSTPQVIGGREEHATLTPIDLQELTTALEQTIEQAKADDPRELRKRIGALERELAQVHRDHTAEQPVPEPERVEVPVITAEHLAELARLVEALDAAAAKADEVSDKAVATAAALRSDLAKVHQQPPAPARPATSVRVEAPRHTVERTLDRLAQAPPPGAGRPMPPATAGEVGRGGLQRILIALAQRPQGLSTAQIGVRARLSSTSGTFDTYLSRARQAGWIQGDRARLNITRAGLAALGRFTPLPTGHELLEHWLQELGQSGAARMLSALAAVYPKALSKVALGQAANISSTSGTFDTYLSRLRRLELVEGKTELRASEELFS